MQSYMEDNAALKLQSSYRGHKARKAVRKKREKARETRVADGSEPSSGLRRQSSGEKISLRLIFMQSYCFHHWHPPGGHHPAYDDDFEEDFVDDANEFASSGDDGGGYIPSAVAKKSNWGFSKPGFAEKKKKKNKFSFWTFCSL